MIHVMDERQITTSTTRITEANDPVLDMKGTLVRAGDNA
jgi:hypothetical protein